MSFLPTKAELFVDTQSLYHEICRQYGENVRMDFLKLPFRVQDEMRGFYKNPEFQVTDKSAFVVHRKGGTEHFSVTLKDFGYKIISLAQGAQDVDITLNLVNLEPKLDSCLIFVSCNKRLNSLLHTLSKRHQIMVITLPGIFVFDTAAIQSMTIEPDWLWQPTPKEEDDTDFV